ncbi:hypothetical protein [Salininema proteolyticum]|uniref:DUF3168 domain-containing protein n=1 Tax=Salininema proteolyticum TaxID=1607685 RepID=A0ABV8TXP7_9ACTN
MWNDALATVGDYLRPLLAPATVASRPPGEDGPPSTPLIQLRRIGGRADPPVREHIRLDVWAWHTTEPDAWALALAARSAIWDAPGTLAGCYRVAEAAAPRSADDALGGMVRVWATYELTVRANDAIGPA